MTSTPEFDKAFETFFQGCESVYQKHCEANKFAVDPFSVDKGSRYVKVVKGTGVFCFVDKKNGDVLKAASWKIPAKHARGNIFDNTNGLSWIGPYGPAYLK